MMNKQQRARWKAICAAGVKLPFSAGHFYSCIPDLGALAAEEDRVFHPVSDNIPGIDLRIGSQLELLGHLASLTHASYPTQPQPPFRYYSENDYFGPGEATLLTRLLRYCEPRRIVEIGSGFSSAVLLDVCDMLLPNRPEIAFIEPFPDRLQELLHCDDSARCEIIRSRVQDVPLDCFESLRDNDILFIDSSHVSKTGSDVNYLFFDVLPRLASGVWIHVHDVYWPFEYPKDWVYEGKWWNEAYLLRAFLQYNESFQIEFYTQYLVQRQREPVLKALPELLTHAGSSFWLRRR